MSLRNAETATSAMMFMTATLVLIARDVIQLTTLLKSLCEYLTAILVFVTICHETDNY